jgi:hypothetical protein
MSADIVDEESRLALLSSIGVEGKPEGVAQSNTRNDWEWKEPVMSGHIPFLSGRSNG